MSVAKIMSKSPVMVEMDNSLKVVKDIFNRTRFHHLLVVDSGRLTGVISDRDLLKVLSPAVGTPAETSRDAAALNKKAHQIMTREPISISPDVSILDAIDIFNTHAISCIPVVVDDGRPVGIVSWRDILRFIAAQRDRQSAGA